MKIKEVIKNAVYVLREKNVSEPNLKSKILLSYTLKKDKTYLITHDKEEIDFETQKIYFSYVDRLINGEPIQYITNSQDFMGFNFWIDKNVLIPQPDTEILVEEVLKYINGVSFVNNDKKLNDFGINNLKINKDKLKILDLCTGSGAIAISIAKNAVNTVITASDISKKALEVAKKNARRLNAEVEFIESDMFKNINDKFNIIISNPPYIETDTIDGLPKEVQNEPHLALDGGKDGLDFYRIIAKESKKYLLEDGKIFLEIGYNQRKTVVKIFEDENYKNIECIKDYSGNDRVIIAKI